MGPWKRRGERKLAGVVESLGIGTVIAPSRVVRIVEFALAGAVASVANVAIFLLAATHVGYVVAGTVAFFLGITIAFAINWTVTFDRPPGSRLRQYAQYLGVSVGGYVFYITILLTALDVLYLPAVLADLVAIAGGGVVNYIGSEKVAFDVAT